MKDVGHRVYAGLFLISLAGLMLEVALTRILAVAFWHHLAFLVISIALFGIAASGTYLTLKQGERDLGESLSLYSTAFSISTVLGFVVINEVPFDPFRFFLERSHILLIFAYYLLLSLPFFFFGLCIALSFSKKPEDSGKLYFANLSGSGAGALGVLGIFKYLGGSGAVLLCAVLGLSASFFFSEKRRVLNGVVLIGLISLLLAPSNPLEVNMSPYKPLNRALLYPGSRIVSTDWNSISRVDVLKSGYVRIAPGLSLSYQEPLPPQLGLVIDGGGVSAITEFKGGSVEFTRFLTSSSAYNLSGEGRVLIIESGGGLEVIQALSHNASHVTVLETNPLVVETVSELKGFSRVYEDPRVEVIVADVRSYLKEGSGTFQVIEIGLGSSAPASSTGVYALSENYLFTVEAFKEYLNHLSEDGILSVTRRLEPPPREGLRTVSLAASALKGLGVEDPGENVAVLRSIGTITVLIKKDSFRADEIERLEAFARSRMFDLIYLPGGVESETNQYNRFPGDSYSRATNRLLTDSEMEKFLAQYLFDVSPVRDANPFFFQFFKPGRLLDTYESVGGKWQVLLEGSFILYLLLAQALILCIVFIILPLAVPGRWPVKRISRKRRLLYFFLIGVGFMFVEIPLIQMFILFLGTPVYAISTVLFGLLVFSGLGSLYTNQRPVTVKGLRYVLTLLATSILLYLFLVPWFFDNITISSLSIRYAAGIIMLAPLGFLMGMPLPTGITLLGLTDAKLIPWAWAANGSASVLSSILAVVVAMHTDFFQVVVLASLAYAFSLAIAVTAFAPPPRKARKLRS